MDKDDVIRKIKAASKLMGSDNPGEAENAARQVRAMMEKYRIDEGDLLAAEVEECQAKAGADKAPVRWECSLAQTVAKFYGVELVFSSGYFTGGQWKFIGVEPAGQLAQYAFEQLFTKCKSARRAYMDEKLKRMKVAKNKTAKADLFAEGWVSAVRRLLPALAPTERARAAMDAFMQRKHPQLGEFEPRQNQGRQSANDGNHRANGFDAGKDVNLHRGVTTGGAPKALPKA